MTGLLNHRFLSDALDRELVAAKDLGNHLSILFVDLDRFKSVNDRHGHLAGNTLLAEVAQLLASTLRSADLITRFGGDEFMIILRNADVQNATRIRQRIRKLFLKTQFLVNGEIWRQGLSIGLASYPADASSVQELVVKADQDMYRQKQASSKGLQS